MLLLRSFFPWLLEERNAFEKKNLTDAYARSFAVDGQVADFCVEVSSQGEFQQILPVLNSLLGQKARVELLYASESLEKDIQEFKSQAAIENLRVLRLPLVNRSFFRRNVWNLNFWVTARNFAFVRYDFYPHLVSLCFRQERSCFLFWGSLKNKELSGLKGWFWANLSRSFQKIFAADELSLQKFKDLKETDQAEVAEFRVLAIDKRIEAYRQKFHEKNCQNFFDLFQKDKRQKLILGSAYLEDLALIENEQVIQRCIEDKLILTIAPHKLDAENLRSFLQFIEQQDRLKMSVVENDQDLKNINFQKTHILLFTGKGLLCEFYRVIDIAYVGGGFEKSIHSVLEPFWAGCQVLCGPQTHRSTEYDLCCHLKKENIRSIKKRHELGHEALKLDSYKNEFHNRELVFKEFIENQKKTLNQLVVEVSKSD